MSPPLNERLIVALDVASAADARKIVASIGNAACFYKVGLQLFTAEGPSVVRDLAASGKQVFLDLKFHDIPNTVAAAVRSAAELKVQMLTVHASGGSKMLQAAVATAADAKNPPMVLAITVLTSMEQSDMDETGVTSTPLDQVLRLAALARHAGCGGVVASPQEVNGLRGVLGAKMAIVTPGVRPAGSDTGDQARTATPAEAIRAGASHLVVGRPITGADSPAEAARAILEEICSAGD